MAGKSAKSKTKKASKPVKKAAKSIVKKANNKGIKKSKKVTVKAKPKIKSSSKKTSTKVKVKAKYKSNAVRASTLNKLNTLKKKHVTTDIKSTKSHVASKAEKKSTVKKHQVDKPSFDVPSAAFEPDAVVLDNDTVSALEDSNLFVTPELHSEQCLSGPSSKFTPYQAHSTEEYMNEQQLQHFTKILHDWKQELMMEVDHTISEMKDADVLADLNDRATQEEAFNLELRARDRERKLIKKIEKALNKIKNHEYGYCDTCGVEIGVRRLEARPTATLCIECKTLAEIREKRV